MSDRGWGQSSIIRTNIAGSFARVTFTMDDVMLAGYTYDPAMNHDLDGDSGATGIVVPRP